MSKQVVAILIFAFATIVVTVAAELRIGGSDRIVTSTTLHLTDSARLMRRDAGAPIRVVPVFSWNEPASGPLLAGRDCVQEPSTCNNGRGGVDIVYAATANVPARAMRGTVLGDTACEPDAEGASHCLNRIRTADGKVFTVRNDHRLANQVCLSPGEHIVIAPGSSAAASLPSLRHLAARRSGAWPSSRGAVSGSCIVSPAGLVRAGITIDQLRCALPQS
jgi:hypothetical protein